MRVNHLDIDGLVVFEPKIFTDSRGSFFESYNKRIFEEMIGYSVDFVQDNQSKSKKNVLRGIHYQLGQEQGKLVRVLSGSVYDVAVDIRPHSRSFGHWCALILSEENKKQLWLPQGMAHGFLVLSDTAEVVYKVSEYYAPTCERTLMWSDPDIAVDWPLDNVEPILSSKDSNGLSWEQARHEIMRNNAY